MNKKDMLEHLAAHGVEPEIHEDKENAISSHFIRGKDEKGPFVAIGDTQDFKEQVCGLAVAVHWFILKGYQKMTCRYVVGKVGNDKQAQEVREALGILLSCLHGITVTVEEDFEPIKLPVPDFSTDGAKWKCDLEKRDVAKAPALLDTIKNRVNLLGFNWYRNVTQGYYYGRVDGINVCRVSGIREKGKVFVGKDGRKGKPSIARVEFLKIAENDFEFSLQNNLNRAIGVIQRLATMRRDNQHPLYKEQPEHRLESKILSGDVIVSVDGLGLEPLLPKHPFQFPTRWYDGGKARYSDALLCHDKQLWVAEAKVESQGQYYLKGIPQAVLYREYIKQAKVFHSWFEERGVEPTECKALLVIPTLEGSPAQRTRALERLNHTAACWQAEVAEVQEP